MWFKTLFGFRESSYERTQKRFALEGHRLRSLENNRLFTIGEFSTPSLAELREKAHTMAKPGRPRISHQVTGDALLLHSQPENAGALFQVASQFNCLEFPGPRSVPEDGVTGYAMDSTQGPACSLAAAAATVYRNYLVPLGGQEGQTRERQIDNLSGLADALDTRGRFWRVENGYVFSTTEDLAALRAAMADHEREELLSAVRIGLHRQVGVTFSDRFTPILEGEPIVSQAFCSAVSCAYSGISTEEWKELATLVLDATYEATLLAAAIDAAEGKGSGKVWLTLVGGGVFGNEMAWITSAIRRALLATQDLDLDVRVAHFRSKNAQVERLVEQG